MSGYSLRFLLLETGASKTGERIEHRIFGLLLGSRIDN